MKSSFMMDGQPSVIPEEQEYSDMSPDIHLRRSPYERDDEDEHKEEGYNS